MLLIVLVDDFDAAMLGCDSAVVGVGKNCVVDVDMYFQVTQLSLDIEKLKIRGSVHEEGN